MVASSPMHPASIEIDGGREDKTGFTMRLAAVILPDLGTGPDVPIVVSHWFAARGDQVWEGERLVEVLVGPATFDVSSPVSGRLAEIHGWEDDRVEAGVGARSGRHGRRRCARRSSFASEARSPAWPKR